LIVSETVSPTSKGEPVPSGKSIIVVVPVVTPATLCEEGLPIEITSAPEAPPATTKSPVPAVGLVPTAT
jgi:hypothetical protein